MTMLFLVNTPDADRNLSCQELSREAAFFHEEIFDRPISEDIQAAYVSANMTLLKDAETQLPVRIDLILARSLDVEAIEFVLRRRSPQNLLTQKVLILCYLAEARSAYFTDFVNEQHQPIRAFISLSVDTCRSVYKLLKGHCLIWMYDVI